MELSSTPTEIDFRAIGGTDRELTTEYTSTPMEMFMMESGGTTSRKATES
jgi:hypothetical protein